MMNYFAFFVLILALNFSMVCKKVVYDCLASFFIIKFLGYIIFSQYNYWT